MAVTLTIQRLALHLRITTSESQPVPDSYVTILVDSLAAATELVERRAPDAPTDSQNMAVGRICAYWFQAPEAAPARFSFHAWQNSGAAEILAPYIDRRAEAV